MNMQKIGKFILQLRQEKNLSQSDLANLIPVTRQAVSRWEKGQSIPDSSTLLIISKIFDVSINELLNGERFKKEEPKKLEKIALDMIDKNNSQSKKFKRVLLFMVLIILLLSFSFLAYYFINSYNSITVYKIEGENKNFTMQNGIFISTKQKTYFRLGKLIYNNNIEVKNVRLYYKNGNKEETIFEDSDADILITDYYGYNEFFPYEDINSIVKKLYLEINYNNNKVEILKLKVKKDFANDIFFYHKKAVNGQNSTKIEPVIKNESSEMSHIISNMREKGNKVDETYVIDKKDQKKDILLTYFENSEEIILDVIENSCTETWNYMFDKEYILVYSKYKNEKLIRREYITFLNSDDLKSSEKSIINSFFYYINKKSVPLFLLFLYLRGAINNCSLFFLF